MVHTATPEQLKSKFKQSRVIMQQVFPPIMSGVVADFNTSKENATRGIVTMYRNSVLSKAKYEPVARGTAKQYNEAAKRTQRLQLAPGVSIDHLLPYKTVIGLINAQDIGTLLPLLSVTGQKQVTGHHRPLKSLLAIMADLVTSNARMQASLVWFGQPDKLFLCCWWRRCTKG